MDVVKSRIMGDKVVRTPRARIASQRFAPRANADANCGLAMLLGAQKQYSGMLDCFKQTYQKEGVFAFYKGFMPNFARLGSWNVVMFLSLEKVRKLYLDSTAAH